MHGRHYDSVPDIALEEHGGRKRYDPIRDGESLEAWCNETFVIEKTATSADEFFCKKHRVSGRYATLHWVPTSKQIALIASHARWDGMGAIMVLAQLFSELDNSTSSPMTLDSSESKKLIPSIDSVVGMPENQPSIGLQPRDPVSLPGESRRTEIVVSAEESTALRAAARAQGISITAAMHASVVVETVRANPESPAKYYTTWTPINLRKFCPAPFNGPVHAPSIRLIAPPLSVEARASWDDLTKGIYAFYHEPWDLDKSDLMFVRVSLVEKATAMFKAIPPGVPPPTEPYISSLGVFDDYIKDRYSTFVVRQLSFMVHMVTQQLCIHIWSWQGRLHISASYNVVYYTPEYVHDFLVAVKNNMFENLIGAT